MSQQPKYKSEIQSLLKDIFMDGFAVDEDNWNEFEEQVMKASRTSYEIMSNQIEEGISNGHSLEFQLGIMRKIYERMV